MKQSDNGRTKFNMDNQNDGRTHQGPASQRPLDEFQPNKDQGQPQSSGRGQGDANLPLNDWNVGVPDSTGKGVSIKGSKSGATGGSISGGAGKAEFKGEELNAPRRGDPSGTERKGGTSK
jgi:hypothetical protein